MCALVVGDRIRVSGVVDDAAPVNAELSQSLNFAQVDRVPQRTLDHILWQAVHGRGSAPPPPGPGAERAAPSADADG